MASQAHWAAVGRTDRFQSSSACLLAFLLLAPMTAATQDVMEPDLKAAFIYNFALFTQWPADAVASGAPLIVCVFGDAAIGAALERAVKDRTAAGHRIMVSQADPNARPLAPCHIAYLSRMKPSEAAEVVAGLRDAPVLTISDAEGFTQQGGIAQFSFEHGQLRFSIRLESAQRARLRISSRLLSLATIK